MPLPSITGLPGVSADHIALGSISQMQFEPQRVSNFLLLIAPPSGSRGGGTEPAASDRGNQNIIALSVIDFPMPEETTEPIELAYGNEFRYVAGKTKFSDEALRVVDYIDADTATILMNWRKLVYNPGPSDTPFVQGGVGYAYQYKTRGRVNWMGPHGGTVRSWILHGLWPMRIKYGGGNMAASDKNVIEVTFKVDRITLDEAVSNELASEAAG